MPQYKYALPGIYTLSEGLSAALTPGIHSKEKPRGFYKNAETLFIIYQSDSSFTFYFDISSISEQITERNDLPTLKE